MKIVYLTTGDPLYLPGFFERVLSRSVEDTLAVYVVPPLYKKETQLQALVKYHRTFGLFDTAVLGGKVLCARLKGQSIRNVCRSRKVPCFEVADVNSAGFLDELRRAGPDLIVSVSCPQIFKKPLIEMPPLGILNLHGAILPNYRGVMPSFWMLANGEAQAGVSIYFVNEKIDAGELCGQKIFNIGRRESLDHFIRHSKAIAADLLLNTLRRMKKSKIKRVPLDLTKGSYFSWPDAQAVQRFRSAGHQVW